MYVSVPSTPHRKVPRRLRVVAWSLKWGIFVLLTYPEQPKGLPLEEEAQTRPSYGCGV